jgi:outer membrane protein OmpA-like peptidoglycan-associated protein
MKTVRLIVVAAVLVISGGTANAQFLKNLGKKAEDAAKRAVERTVERKTEQKTEDAVGKTIDKATDLDTYKSNGDTEEQTVTKAKKSVQSNLTDEAEAVEAAAPVTASAVETAYAKSDFVAGDVIIFDDPMTSEQMGEFPSQWDLLHGNAEVASINGLKCINLEAGTTATVAPLMADMKNYLPDVFTIELDYWVNSYTETHKTPSQHYTLNLYGADNRSVMALEFAEGRVSWNYRTPAGESRNGSMAWKEKINSWSHLSVSFNKRAFKAYINGVRTVNLPNMAAPKYMSIYNTSWKDHRTAITNVRIAKGAVPLYDRLTTDGKIITYGITFDTGQSTIKPESLGEINRIVKLMTENPTLKFSVEGHTDNTGSAATNQSLSDARSKAVVDKLVELGVSKSRLQSAGKGQTAPIADNSTDEGRAKNRRVEFVKI